VAGLGGERNEKRETLNEKRPVIPSAARDPVLNAKRETLNEETEKALTAKGETLGRTLNENVVGNHQE